MISTIRQFSHISPIEFKNKQILECEFIFIYKLLNMEKRDKLWALSKLLTWNRFCKICLCCFLLCLAKGKNKKAYVLRYWKEKSCTNHGIIHSVRMHTEVLSFQYSEIPQPLINLGTDSRHLHEKGKLRISPIHVCLNWISFRFSVASPGSYSVIPYLHLVWKWYFPRFMSLSAKFHPEIWPTGSSALN